jgi:uncharacterized protein (TIGR03118 family)
MTFHQIARRGTALRDGFLFAIVASAAGSYACSSSNNNPATGPTTDSSATGGTDGGVGGSHGGVGGSHGGTSGGGGVGGEKDGGEKDGTANGGAGGHGGGGGAAGSEAGIPPDGGEEAGVPVAFMVKQTDLVANTSGKAPTTDPNLTNAWGLVPNPTAGLFWVADNHAGIVSVYPPAGGASVLDVPVPGPDGKDAGSTSAPTGQVFNATAADFMGDKFILSSENGTIAGWQTQGKPFVIRVDNSADSGYKGLAIVKNGAAQMIVAANFHKGTVDVFDASYAPVASPGFIDAGSPALPAGFVAFNVVSIGNSVYISYAKQDAAKADDAKGPGNGYVSVFMPNGTFTKRLVSGGALNSPWGMVLAPTTFGALAGALLVGNFGDGKVNAYDAATGDVRGSLHDTAGPLVIQGLWALVAGPKTSTEDFSSSIYFTAGPNDEADGLFGKLDAK